MLLKQEELTTTQTSARRQPMPQEEPVISTDISPANDEVNEGDELDSSVVLSCSPS